MASNYPKTKIQALKQTFVSRPVTSLHHAPTRSPDFLNVGSVSIFPGTTCYYFCVVLGAVLPVLHLALSAPLLRLSLGVNAGDPFLTPLSSSRRPVRVSLVSSSGICACL